MIVGDIIAFYGDCFSSKVIEWITFGPSHVAIVAEIGNLGEVLVESVTGVSHPCLIQGKEVNGVQVHHIRERLKDYNNNAVVFRMRKPWRITDAEGKWIEELLRSFINHHDEYDTLHELLAPINSLTGWSNPDPWKQFCSEMVASCLMRVGRLPLGNPASYTPGGLVRTLKKIGIVKEIKL